MREHRRMAEIFEGPTTADLNPAYYHREVAEEPVDPTPEEPEEPEEPVGSIDGTFRTAAIGDTVEFEDGDMSLSSPNGENFRMLDLDGPAIFVAMPEGSAPSPMPAGGQYVNLYEIVDSTGEGMPVPVDGTWYATGSPNRDQAAIDGHISSQEGFGITLEYVATGVVFPKDESFAVTESI